MQRWRWIAAAFAVATVTGAIATPNAGAAGVDAPVPTAEAADASRPPNVVFIMTDDQDAASLEFMPKTRQLLGDSGTTFTHAITNFPLCCPARATMVTGQTAHNHGVLWNADAEFGGYKRLDHAESLPSWFQRAGYTTSFMGKYLNGYGCNLEGLQPFVADDLEVPHGWNDWGGLVCQTEYRMYNYTINDNGTLRTPNQTSENYQTDYLARRAVNRIESFGDDPFFLMVAPLAPHGEGGKPPRAAPRHVGSMSTLPLPTSPSFNEPDVSDKPPHIRNLPSLTATKIDAMTTWYRARIESLQAVDDLVESVVTKLTETGQLDNTIIIYTSDNGWFSGEHRIDKGKIEAYEEALHLPLVIRGGPFTGGTVVDTPVTNVDVVPTMAALTGIDATRVMDGVSLEHPIPNRGILIETGPKFPETDYRGIRTPYWKYIERAEGSKELYDLANDPYELANKINVPAFDAVESKLAAALGVLQACSGATCVMRMGGPQNADFAPQVAAAPQSTTAFAGATATFSVTATGSGVTYQWQRDGVDIAGATSSTYTTPPLTASEDGATYRVVLTNIVGTDTSPEATLAVVDNGESSDWFDGDREARLPIVLTGSEGPRLDATFEVPLDLAAIDSAPISVDSLRVVELAADSSVVGDVPFQWEPGEGTNGVLVVQAPGTTAPDVTRRFHVYMSTASGLTPPAATDQVVVTTGVASNDLTNAMRIATPGGSWIYDVDGGAFAGLFDENDVDWIGWSRAPKSGGEFRGIPNPVNPEGQLHPGMTDATTTVLSDGPVRMSLRSVTDDGLWAARWDISSRSAVLTLEQGAHAYWIVYEGVPGGAVDPADLTIQSDGDVEPLDAYWDGDIGRKEWIATTDPNDGQSLVLGNLEDDTAIDSSWVYRNQGVMAVVGLGRRFDVPAATDFPHQFVVSLIDTAVPSEVSDQGFGLITPAVAVVGVVQGGTPQPPTIVSQPRSMIAAVGVPATFSVQARGTAPLHYQWQRNGVDIDGATLPTYTVAAAAAADNGAQFGVLVSNEIDSVLSDPAVLSVNNTVPKLQVLNASVTEGNASTTLVTVTVELTAAKKTQVRATLKTANGTAKLTDYVARSGVPVVFAPGTTVQTITVAVKGDTVGEPNETFKVSIATNNGAPVLRRTGTVTILDDD